MVPFKLNGEDAYIGTGRYPNGLVGWRVFSSEGEHLGDPTVNMDAYGERPAEGNVFIKVGREYAGYLESFQKQGIVGEEIRAVGAQYTDRYCVEVPVLRKELL